MMEDYTKDMDKHELEYVTHRLVGVKTPRELRKVYRDLKKQGLIQKHGLELPFFILYPHAPLYMAYGALVLSIISLVLNLARLVLTVT